MGVRRRRWRWALIWEHRAQMCCEPRNLLKVRAESRWSCLLFEKFIFVHKNTVEPVRGPAQTLLRGHARTVPTTVSQDAPAMRHLRREGCVTARTNADCETTKKGRPRVERGRFVNE